MTTSAQAVLRTELRLFSREPGSLFWIMVFPAGLLTVLGLIPAFTDPDEGVGGVTIIELYVPVAVLLAILMASVSAIPINLAVYREQLILKRISTTPARARDLLAAQYLVHGAAAVLGGALAMAVGRLAYGVGLPGNVVAYVGVLALVLAACLALGGLVGGLAPTAKMATAIGSTLLFPLMFTAGVWLPVAAMPGLLGDIVSFTPLGAGALALDAASAGQWPAWRDVAVVGGWALVLGGLGARYFRWR